jgi:hypothetical protein
VPWKNVAITAAGTGRRIGADAGLDDAGSDGALRRIVTVARP